MFSLMSCFTQEICLVASRQQRRICPGLGQRRQAVTRPTECPGCDTCTAAHLRQRFLRRLHVSGRPISQIIIPGCGNARKRAALQ